MFGIEKKIGGMRRLDISHIVISHDMGHDITIYHAISHRTTQNQQTRNLVAVSQGTFSFGSVFALFLACLSSAPTFMSAFSCSSAGNLVGLTAPPADGNSNLVSSGLGLLPERLCMLVFVSYVFFFPLFISLSFCLLRTLTMLIVATYSVDLT